MMDNFNFVIFNFIVSRQFDGVRLQLNYFRCVFSRFPVPFDNSELEIVVITVHLKFSWLCSVQAFRGVPTSDDTNFGRAVFTRLSNRLDIVAKRVVVVAGRVIVGDHEDFVLFAGETDQ